MFPSAGLVLIKGLGAQSAYLERESPILLKQLKSHLIEFFPSKMYKLRAFCFPIPLGLRHVEICCCEAEKAGHCVSDPANRAPQSQHLGDPRSLQQLAGRPDKDPNSL